MHFSFLGLVLALVGISHAARPAIPKNPGRGWADSYSANGKCYCATTFDHNIGPVKVQTPYGTKTVFEICKAVGKGPGVGRNPVYNDVQCGNGPANDAGDEDYCPGRVDKGKRGCWEKGPKWDLSVLAPKRGRGAGRKAGLPLGRVVWLRKARGARRYISALKTGSRPLVAKRSKPRGWERFQVVPHPGGKGMIALKAMNTGRYVQVPNRSTQEPVRAAGSAPGLWEAFRVRSLGGRRVALQSAFTGLWLQAEHRRLNSPVFARGKRPRSWETFEWGYA